MMDFDKILETEIVDEIEGLRDEELGTEKHKAAVDSVATLMDRAIELKKLDIEAKEKAENRDIDLDLKLKQMDEERKDRFVKNCISVAGVVIPVGVTIWGTLASFKFEQEGTITTIMGRGFINKLLPKK